MSVHILVHWPASSVCHRSLSIVAKKVHRRPPTIGATRGALYGYMPSSYKAGNSALYHWCFHLTAGPSMHHSMPSRSLIFHSNPLLMTRRSVYGVCAYPYPPFCIPYSPLSILPPPSGILHPVSSILPCALPLHHSASGVLHLQAHGFDTLA